MPHSSLAYRDDRPDRDPAPMTIVALHGGEGNIEDIAPFVRKMAPNARIVVPEAARGVYNFRTMVSHNWYGWSTPARPEPASFGDSFAQIERFLHDVRLRALPGEMHAPVLIGAGQGGVLATAAAGVFPDLMSGAVVIAGCLPELPSDDLLEMMKSDLPVLIVAQTGDLQISEKNVSSTVERLAALGCQITLEWLPEVFLTNETLQVTVSTWLEDNVRT